MPTGATRRACPPRCAFARSGGSPWRTCATCARPGFDDRGGGRRRGLRDDDRVSHRARADGTALRGGGARACSTPGCPGATTSCSLEAMGRALPPRAWRRVTWGQGTKGPLAARFVARRVRLRHGRGDRWVLFERSLADDERKYYVLNLEPTASLKTPRAAGPQSLADRTAVPGTERRTRPGSLRRADVPGLGAPHGPDRRGVHVPAIGTASVAGRAASRPCRACGRGCGKSWRFMYVAGNEQLFNLAVSFRRNPPLRR